MVLCGNSIISPQCSLCPKTNGTKLNSWCSGNCELEESTGICKEKCRFLGSVVFQMYLSINSLLGFSYHLTKSHLIITAKYVKVVGFDCEVKDQKYQNLYDAKQACWSDNECTWIMDKKCDDLDFEICSNTKSLSSVEDGIETCAHSKTKITGKR